VAESLARSSRKAAKAAKRPERRATALGNPKAQPRLFTAGPILTQSRKGRQAAPAHRATARRPGFGQETLTQQALPAAPVGLWTPRSTAAHQNVPGLTEVLLQPAEIIYVHRAILIEIRLGIGAGEVLLQHAEIIYVHHVVVAGIPFP